MKKALWLAPAAAVAVFFYVIKASPLTMTAYTLMAIAAYASTIIKYERDIDETNRG